MVRRLVTWNADGLAEKRQELIHFLGEYDVDVALLQETHLRPGRKFTIPNYAVYRTDRAGDHPAGGTAVLVHRRVPHRHIPHAHPLESTTIATPLGDSEVRLSSVYHPPGSPLDADVMDWLLPVGVPSLAGGDFNAKHTHWGCLTTNTRGRQMKRYLDMRRHIGVCTPREPTHVPYNRRHRADLLDFALHSNFPAAIDPHVVVDLTSDHLPVVFNIETGRARLLPPTRPPKVNWRRYLDRLADRPRPPPCRAATVEQLEGQIADLTSTLQAAVRDSSIPQSPGQAIRKTLPPHLLAEVREKRHLRAEWQRTRCPRARTQFLRQARRVKALLQEHSEGRWTNYLCEMSSEMDSLWRLARTLRQDKKVVRPVRSPAGLVYSPEDKAEVFADSLQEQFSPHPDIFDEDHVQHVEDFLEEIGREEEEDPVEELPLPVTSQEVASILASLKTKKAPGPDTLGSPALRHLPPWVVDSITSIFNSCFSLRYFPAPWKLAKVILIPKPKKNLLLPENHRPISLLPTLSKVLERLILARFPPDFHQAIRSEQFGFRGGHSTTLQLARVINTAASSLANRRHTTAVLVDVSKAFDKVWHQGLLYKLAHSPLPRSLLFLLSSYLTGRRFTVSVGSATSTTRPVAAGVPQGSVLGPILYLWYTNDIPVAPSVSLSLYADDAMFMATSLQVRQSTVYLQRQLSLLEPWLRKWRVMVNADKSEAICFSKKRDATVRRNSLSVNGQVVPWKTAVKYLGVTLDRRLTMTPHTDAKVNTAKAAAIALGPILRSPSVSIVVKVLLYKAIIRPAVMYASPAWFHLISRTARRKLEACQSRTLRRATNSPWYVRNSVIRDSAGVETLQEFSAAARRRMEEAAAESAWEHIREIVDQPPTQLRRPPWDPP